MTYRKTGTLTVSPEYGAQCEAAYGTLGIRKLTLQNVWLVFTHMLPLV